MGYPRHKNNRELILFPCNAHDNIFDSFRKGHIDFSKEASIDFFYFTVYYFIGAGNFYGHGAFIIAFRPALPYQIRAERQCRVAAKFAAGHLQPCQSLRVYGFFNKADLFAVRIIVSHYFFAHIPVKGSFHRGFYQYGHILRWAYFYKFNFHNSLLGIAPKLALSLSRAVGSYPPLQGPYNNISAAACHSPDGHILKQSFLPFGAIKTLSLYGHYFDNISAPSSYRLCFFACKTARLRVVL
jgi:hypothetical protein